MTNSEVNETIARALGFLDVTQALCFMGDGVYVENQLNAYDRTITGCYRDYRSWTGSTDACFRDLVPHANARGWFLRTSQLPNGEHRAAFEKSDGTDMRGFSCESLSRSIAYAFVETLHA